ncbi:MAG: methylated-DNA--[protein]-cysteine S-methyltransferase [Dehalococcoidia bacterium]
MEDQTGLYSYSLFNTAFGWVAVVASGYGLRYISLPQPRPEQAMGLIGDFISQAIANTSFFRDIEGRLQAYFTGEPVDFPMDIDIQHATDFQQAVWRTTASIPYGETRTYGWVAQAIGKPQSARGVGQALGQNPLPIVIPCHRVVGDKDLGGFSGGVEMKKRLLELEAQAGVS